MVDCSTRGLRNPGVEAGAPLLLITPHDPRGDYPDPAMLGSAELEKLVPARGHRRSWLLSGPFGLLTSGVVDERGELCHQGRRNWP